MNNDRDVGPRRVTRSMTRTRNDYVADKIVRSLLHPNANIRRVKRQIRQTEKQILNQPQNQQIRQQIREARRRIIETESEQPDNVRELIEIDDLFTLLLEDPTRASVLRGRSSPK